MSCDSAFTSTERSSGSARIVFQSFLRTLGGLWFASDQSSSRMESSRRKGTFSQSPSRSSMASSASRYVHVHDSSLGWKSVGRNHSTRPTSAVILRRFGKTSSSGQCSSSIS